MPGITTNGNTRGGVRKRLLPMALLAALCGPAGAIDVDYEVGVAAKRSDNINLSQSNPISDTVVAPRLFFDARQIGRTVQLTAQGDLEHLFYANNTFNDELRGRFAGQLNWAVLPERLDFVVQDYLSLQPVDTLTEFTPDNQQQVNIFVAGPTLRARFNPTTHGQLDLRYINSYAEEQSTFDSNRFNVAARVIRQFNVNHSGSLNLEAHDARFEPTDSGRNYRRYDGYLNSKNKGKHLDLSVDLGHSSLDQRSGRGSSSYPLARVRLDWNLTPRSQLTATVRHQLSDATQSLMEPREFDRRRFNDFSIPDGLLEPNLFRERLIRTRYTYNGERLTLQAGPYYRRIRYLDVTVENQDRRGGVLTGDYRLRPRLSLGFLALREHRDFVSIGRKDKDLLASVGLANRFTRHWTGRIDLQRRQRDSNAVGRSYDENAVLVSFSYQR